MVVEKRVLRSCRFRFEFYLSFISYFILRNLIFEFWFFYRYSKDNFYYVELKRFSKMIYMKFLLKCLVYS